MKICPACDRRFASDRWCCPSCQWRASDSGRIHVVAGRDEDIEGFSGAFFDNLIKVEDWHFWFLGRNALIADALARWFPAARTFLDAGAGTGQVVRALRKRFPELRYTVADGLAEGLAVAARTLPDVEVVRADVRALPWEDEFDVVGAFDVLEHIANDLDAARQLARAVRPGGGILVTVPQHAWLWGPADDYSRHVRRYSRRQLVDTLLAAGLEVQYTTSFVSLLLPFLAMSRFAGRGKPFVPGREFRISGKANAVGRAALRIEQAVIRGGLSLPVGGSLLAVATRPT